MRFLFIGDPHIKTDNGEEVDILLSEIYRITKEINYDFIVVGGDVMHYHERLFTQALNKSLDFLKNLSKIAYTYVLVGNHDMINNQQFLTDQHWMNVMKSWQNIKIVDDVVEFEDFMLCPYVFPGKFVEALETKTKDWKNKMLIFAHQEFKGCKMGAIESVDGDEWNDEYPQIISGHIHDNQKVGKNIYYPGTPLQHAFGDSDIRILCDIQIDKSLKLLKIIDTSLNVPKKQILKTNIKDIKNILGKIDNIENSKIKIKLDANTDEFKVFKDSKEYKELIDKGVKIQLQKNKDKIKDIVENGNFIEILEKIVSNDEPLVKNLYDEIVLNKIYIDLL